MVFSLFQKRRFELVRSINYRANKNVFTFNCKTRLTAFNLLIDLIACQHEFIFRIFIFRTIIEMNVIEFKARDNSLFINQQLLINLVNWAHHSRSLFILRIAALEKTLWDEPKNILRCQDVRDLPSFSRLHTVAILIDIISRLRLNQFPSLRKSNFFIANWWWEREVIFIC